MKILVHNYKGQVDTREALPSYIYISVNAIVYAYNNVFKEDSNERT